MNEPAESIEEISSLKRRIQELEQAESARQRAEEALHKSEETAKRLAQENDLVAEIGRIISSTLDINEVYECFAGKVREIIPFDSITINIVNTSDNTRTIRYNSGIHIKGREIGNVLPLDCSVTERIVRTRSALLITTTDNEDLLRQYPGSLAAMRAGIQSRMGIPLISKDEVIGTLLLRSVKPHAYGERDLRLAEKVGAQIAGAIANAQLFLERKQAEEALQKNNLDLTAIIDNLPFLAWLKDCEGRFIAVNEQFARTCGLTSPHDLVGKTDLDIWPRHLAEAYRDDDLEVIRTRQKKALEEFIVDRGAEKWFETYKAPLYDVNGTITGTTGIARDITERKQTEEEKQRLEERLHRAEKMEALGTLAGGVAHDLNNVLGVLMGYAEMLRDEIPAGGTPKAYIANILASTEKGASIVRDLLTLARRGVTVAKVINLNGVVSGFLKTPVFEKLQASHPRVTFRTELDPALLNIKGSPIHLEKTVMNLISNAVEAIAESGEVKIRTENHYLDRTIRGYDQVQTGEYAVLTVSDNGSGIRPDDLGKIFEPFYTKKVMGRSGTGLGLAVIWGTVKDHHGYIDVQSVYGEGSTFTLYFPITREEVPDGRKKKSLKQYRGQGESILVVDDVEQQRAMAAMMLTKLGYQVQTAADGEETVQYLKTHTVDLLVLDMIMDPGIDGLETYRQARGINPRQKAILVSGFSETARVKQAQDLGAGAYVKKPYLLETIGLAVREELDRPA